MASEARLQPNYETENGLLVLDEDKDKISEPAPSAVVEYGPESLSELFGDYSINNEGLRVVRDPSDYMGIMAFTASLDYEGFAVAPDGTYAMEVLTDFGIEHVPVGKLVVDLTDEASVEYALGRDDLSIYIKEDIIRLREQVIEHSTEELKMTVFSQSLIYNENVLGARTTLTYNGVPMRTDSILILNTETPYHLIVRGNAAANTARNTFSMVVTAAGMISNIVALVDGGISLLQGFANVTNSQLQTITSNTESHSQVRLQYGITIRITGRIGPGNQLVLGLTTRLVTVTRVNTRTHLVVINRGTTGTTSRVLNQAFHTVNFHNPWTQAFWNTQTGHIRHQDQVVAFRIGNLNFNIR